jgi:predicted chitinase
MSKKRVLVVALTAGVVVAGAAAALLPMAGSSAATRREAHPPAHHSASAAPTVTVTATATATGSSIPVPVPTASGSSAAPTRSTTAAPTTTGGGSSGGSGTAADPAVSATTNAAFVVTEAQFNAMFPNRNPFYTYAGLVDAMLKFPAFATTGTDTVQKQEAAAFLANVNHETGSLVYIREINTANYPHYCDPSQSYGCPAGTAAYYGRGPIQLSWNFNYKAAGDALGVDLLNQPDLVATNSSVAWQTGIWYWMTSTGPGTMTPHNAMVNGAGFGETIRSINGSLECDGRNPATVQSRVDAYNRFVGVLGVAPGANLSC